MPQQNYQCVPSIGCIAHTVTNVVAGENQPNQHCNGPVSYTHLDVYKRQGYAVVNKKYDINKEIEKANA